MAPKQASATVYLMEELGDARMRCDQLLRYLAQATKIVEQSDAKDQIYEQAGHLLGAVPETAFKLHKALQAVALAANRIDYEEVKQSLRPEKVEELERVLEDVRLRALPRHSDPLERNTPMTTHTAALTIKELHTIRRNLEDVVLDVKAVEKEAPADQQAKLKGLAQQALLTIKHLKLEGGKVAAKDQETKIDALTIRRDLEAILKEAEQLAKGSDSIVKAGLDDIIQLMEKSLKMTKQASQEATEQEQVKQAQLVLKGYEEALAKLAGDAPLRESLEAVVANQRALVATLAGDEAKLSRYEEGKPADPTENMSPEDAAEWKKNTEEHKDQFKAAGLVQDRMAASKRLPAVKKLLESKGAERTLGNHNDWEGELEGFHIWVGNPGDSRRGKFEIEVRTSDRKKAVHSQASTFGGVAKQVADAVDHLEVSGRTAGYSADPHWITAKYPGVADDGTPFKKGDRVLYWPKDKKFQVGPKAEAAMKRFEAEVADEAFYNYRAARFEEGKPVDPTENMSPEDAKKWEDMNEEHGDLLKTASDRTARYQGTPDQVLDRAKKLVKALLAVRVEVRDLGDDLSDISHDATGITFNLYRDRKVDELAELLYRLDRDLGPAYEKVEDILPVLKKGVKTASTHQAALVLWQYTDEDGKDFYLAEKKLGSIKSPYTGKTFTAKPSKFSMANVGKELKEDGAKAKNALWKYTDGDSKEFWLPARVTGTIKSPWTGKGFTGKPVKENLTGVAKELKEESKKASLDLFALTQDEGEQASDEGQDKEASLDLFALAQDDQEGQDKTAAASSGKEHLQDKIKGWKDGDSANLSDLARGYRGKYQDLESAAKALGKAKVVKFDGSKVTKLASEQEGQDKTAAGLTWKPTLEGRQSAKVQAPEGAYVFDLQEIDGPGVSLYRLTVLTPTKVVLKFKRQLPDIRKMKEVASAYAKTLQADAGGVDFSKEWAKLAAEQDLDLFALTQV